MRHRNKLYLRYVVEAMSTQVSRIQQYMEQRPKNAGVHQDQRRRKSAKALRRDKSYREDR